MCQDLIHLASKDYLAKTSYSWQASQNDFVRHFVLTRFCTQVERQYLSVDFIIFLVYLSVMFFMTTDY